MDYIRNSKKRIQISEELKEQGSMKKGTVVFVTLFAIFKINCLGQIRDFEDILTHPIRNRNILKVDDSTRSERTFLGVIKNSNGKVVFYVAKEFYTVQTALVMHGHSRILFFNNDKKLTAAYNVDGPGELPYKLSRNSLYFKVTRDGNELIQIINVRAKLPVPLCILPDDCYWPQKK
jgi:hypothetical protein